MIFIYVLINPTNDEVFYVGATKTPNARLAEHCCDNCDTHKGRAISIIRNLGLKPELLVVDIVHYSKVSFYEDFYSDLFRSFGFNLTSKGKSNYKGAFLSSYDKKVLDSKWQEYTTQNDLLSKLKNDIKN